jgi:hypothetical protein
MVSLSGCCHALYPGTPCERLPLRDRALSLPMLPDARSHRQKCSERIGQRLIEPVQKPVKEKPHTRAQRAKRESPDAGVGVCRDGKRQMEPSLPVVWRADHTNGDDAPRGESAGWVRLSQIVRPNDGFMLSSGYAICLMNPTTAQCQKLLSLSRCRVSCIPVPPVHCQQSS